MNILSVRFCVAHSRVISLGWALSRCRPTVSQICRAASKATVRGGLGAGVPDMELEGPVLSQPQQCRQIVGEDVTMLLVFVIGKYRHRFHEVRLRLVPMFLVEALTMYAFGHADHGQRPVLE